MSPKSKLARRMPKEKRKKEQADVAVETLETRKKEKGAKKRRRLGEGDGVGFVGGEAAEGLGLDKKRKKREKRRKLELGKKEEEGGGAGLRNGDGVRKEEHETDGRKHLDGIDKDSARENKKLGKKKKSKLGLKKRSGTEKSKRVAASSEDHIMDDGHADNEDTQLDGINVEGLPQEHKKLGKKKKNKLGLKKGSRKEKRKTVDANSDDHIMDCGHADTDSTHSGTTLKSDQDHNKRLTHHQRLHEGEDAAKDKDVISQTNVKKKKRGNKKLNPKKKVLHIPKEGIVEESQDEVDEGVEEILSVDEDCTRGMKKWLMKYKESRPGLKVLQERIDDFMTAYEEQKEQERKEREAQAAERGWTVVTHHKGRKKTTDEESGITMGSVAQAAVMDKMEKKKSKAVPLDFYRFQKREAKRNEVMLLQSKFEQDKKRLQELRAARKFRPY